MMGQNKIKKSVYVIDFSGKYSDWKYWSHKFLAGWSKKDYREVLDGTSKILTKTVYDQAKLNASPDANQEEIIKKCDRDLAAY